MKSSEAKKVAQCVSDMIDTDLKHSIRHVPLVLAEMVVEYLKTYVPESDSKLEVVESRSSKKQ